MPLDFTCTSNKKNMTCCVIHSLKEHKVSKAMSCVRLRILMPYFFITSYDWLCTNIQNECTCQELRKHIKLFQNPAVNNQVYERLSESS